MDAKHITPEQTWPLRSSVLRPGAPIEDCDFDGDRDAGTAHIGAVDADGAILSIGSIYREDRGAELTDGADPHAGNSWRLRGMATAPEARRRGAGAVVLAGCEQHARDNGATLVWCNARTGAVAFYESQGWVVVSGEFDIPGVGPHVVMQRPV